jgi:hypothetical protein
MKILVFIFLLLAACAPEHKEAFNQSIPNHHGPQCINGQQQFVDCPEGQ